MIAVFGSLLRWFPALVAAGLVAVWIAAWRSQPPPDSVASRWKSDNQTLIEKLRVDNPQAARNLERLQQHHSGRAFTAVLNDAYHRDDVAGLAEVARGRKNQLLAMLDLVDAQAFPTAEAREEFLLAHGAYHQMLLTAGLDAEAERYLTLLKTHQATPADREAIKDDATAVLVWDAVSDPESRAFYLREREWLAPLLAELRLASIESPELTGTPDGPDDLATVLRAAQAYHPLPRQAAVDLQLGSPGLQLFLQQGAVIQACVLAHKLPLDETLDVVFGNLDWVNDRGAEGRTPEQVAQRLATTAASRPGLWNAARRFPLALRLNDDAPDHAEQVLQEFGPDGAAELLYSNYENEVRPATAAVAHYGERGFSVLVRYAGDERLQKLLARPDVGPRAVPFMAKFGDAGLDRVEANVAWIDRYFERDGREKGEPWWAAAPLVGAPAQVATNWIQGHPSEWSELGWAALDVADSTLLVMSFGVSAPASVSKETLKQGGKAVVMRSARLAAQQSARGGRSAARAVGGSLLRRFVASVATSSVGVVVRQSAKTVAMPLRAAWNGIKRAVDAWRATSVVQRRLIYRGLFALGLTITIVNRTIPMSREAIAAGLEKVHRWVSDARDLVLTEPLKEFSKLLGLGPATAGRWTLDLVFGLGLAVLLYVLYRVVRWTQPWRSRSLSYV